MSIIEEVIEKLDDWKGKEISVQLLSGGLTNTNYKVTVDGIPFFIRVPGEGTELLAIDRNNEYHSAKAAEKAGVGPRVLYHLPEYHVMVLEFLQGITMSRESLNAPGMPKRMAESIRRLHTGERLLLDFNMFRLTEYYLSLCKERSIRIPDGYLERMDTVKEIETAMSLHPLATVPCLSLIHI